MDLFESVLYGLISGLSEFLPISSSAHRRILQHLFGSGNVPFLDTLVHFAALCALFTVCFPMLSRIQREQRKITSQRYRRNAPRSKTYLELRLLKTAALPMCIVMLVLLFAFGSELSLPVISILLIVNGLVLFLGDHIRHGNKDANMMSKLSSFFIGLCGAFSVLPGISGIGIRTTVAEVSGADRQHAFQWSLLLGIPALIISGVGSILQIITYGFENFTALTALYYLLGTAAAYLGAYGAIQLMRVLIRRSGIHSFAYYSWGAALFIFILYLI